MRTVCVSREGPANALALSPDDSQVVIAGRNVFKIYSIEEDELVEKANLRAGKNLNLNFSCNDVVWNPVEDSVLATAATNGAVVTWNLNKSSRSKLDLVFNDHKRTVHKVSFHPSEAHLLISGSQDGFMKLFDLRRKEAAYTFESNGESVRNVQFNPHVLVQFCAVTESGYVQLWDMRRTDRVERNFSAHFCPIFALDWHPENKNWIATAARDKTIKVWDLNDPGPTCAHFVQTIASVGRIKWRPEKYYHIASSALVIDCSISVWDVRRPYIPLATFNEHKNFTTGIAWSSDPNSLFSVAKDCTLIHHDFQDATRPVDRVNPVGLDISIQGQISNAFHISDETENANVNLNKQSVCKKSAVNDHRCQVLSSVQILKSMKNTFLSAYHIVETAKNYLLTGRSLAEICEHNAGVAKRLNRPQIALTWKIIEMLYLGVGSCNDHLQVFSASSRDDSNVQPETTIENEVKSSRHYSGGEIGVDTSGGFSPEEIDSETDDNDTHDLKLTHIASGMTHNQDFFFGDGEINQMPFEDDINSIDTSQDWKLPSEAFQPRDDLLHRQAPTISFEEYSTKCSPRELNESSVAGYIVEPASVMRDIVSPGEASWESGHLVHDMLVHYASSGDVQMAVTCIIVLGDRLKGLLDEAQAEHWFLSYVDLLQKFQLWNVSNQVIQLAGLEVVQQQNQKSTTVTVKCGQCGHTLQRNNLMCSKCGCITSTCVVCHGVVHGIYVWCQGCAHGGHINHIMQWMLTNSDCPAGCGHTCEYT